MGEAEQLTPMIVGVRQSDINQSFSYHAWVVPEYKCLCMTIPKVACTTVKATLYHLAGNPVPEDVSDVHGHDVGMFLGEYDDAEIATILSSPEWVRFCFVRNPYHRLFSAYKSKIGNTWDTQYEWLRAAIREKFDYPVLDDRRAGMVTFEHFVRFLVDSDAGVRYELDPNASFDGHFNIQSRILMPHLIRYDIVGRFESLSEDLGQILTRLGAPEETIALSTVVRNPTPKIPLAAAYSHDLASLVYELYRQDFDAFGYDRDSWLFDS